MRRARRKLQRHDPAAGWGKRIVEIAARFGGCHERDEGDDCGGWSLAHRHTYWRQTGQEYLQASDKSAGDEAAVLKPLVRQFVREGYHSVPDWADLGEEARALIPEKGYRDEDIAEIAREAAIANGMSK